MRKYLSLLPFVAVLIMGCNSDPPCPTPGPEDYVHIYSEKLGDVYIDGEKCQMFQTYQHFDCDWMPGRLMKPNSCSGQYLDCHRYYNPKTLTRITKCPSGTVQNTILYAPGKFHHEQIQ